MQLDYVLQLLERLADGEYREISASQQAASDFEAARIEAAKKSIWATGCKSWYLTADGFNATMYPGFATQFAQQMKTFEPSDYRTIS